MDFIIEYWAVIVAVACMVVCIVCKCISIANGNIDEQQIAEWLKWAVAKAEAELGSGTGQLKLRYVYDMFVQRFGFAAKCVSFDLFSVWVDNALEWFNDQLLKNNNIRELITNESK